MQSKIYLIAAFLTLLLISCGGTTLPSNPIKELKEEYMGVTAYTIILNDMDLQDGQYFHKYKIFTPQKNGKYQTELTDWKAVDDDFFLLHEDDLGMEIFSKRTDGKYNNLVTPPGFTHFIGNEDYGKWSNFDSLRMNEEWLYWIFEEDINQVPNLETDLGLNGLTVTKGEYDFYKENYLLNRPYYGEKLAGDSTKYGTRSRHWMIIYPYFYSRRISKNNFDKPYGGSFSYENRGGGGFGK